tara:strand:+ start:293 stop:568 length:276 start_codon:yes stop_codon:yes gene_type:complete
MDNNNMVLDEWVYILCSKIKGEVVNREIIQLIKARLEIGKKEYGHEVDVFDGRDWEREALEEILDSCVYLAAALLKLIKSKKKGIQNDPEC